MNLSYGQKEKKNNSKDKDSNKVIEYKEFLLKFQAKSALFFLCKSNGECQCWFFLKIEIVFCAACVCMQDDSYFRTFKVNYTRSNIHALTHKYMYIQKYSYICYYTTIKSV